MFHKLSKQKYEKNAQTSDRVPVYRVVPADTLTPISAYRTLTKDSTDGVLLDSARTSKNAGRYSFIGVEPQIKLTTRSGETVLVEQGDRKTLDQHPFDALRTLHQDHRSASIPNLPPLVGGAIGYIGYRSAAETTDTSPQDSSEEIVPELQFLFYDTIIAFDHVQNTATVTCLTEPGSNSNPINSYEDGQEKINHLVGRLRDSETDIPSGLAQMDARVSLTAETTDEEFRSVAQEAIDRIHGGEVEHLTLSRSFRGSVQARPLDIFRLLRMNCPAPFMYLFEHENTAVAGSSRERLVQLSDETVKYQPLTTSSGEHTDRETPSETDTNSPLQVKHSLLLDAVRNDLSNLTEPGSVTIDGFNPSTHPEQNRGIRSTLRGTVREDIGPVDVFQSSLPSLKQTGFPRSAATRILPEIEPDSRGLFGGAICYIDSAGNADSSTTANIVEMNSDTVRARTGISMGCGDNPEDAPQKTRNHTSTVNRAIQFAETKKTP